MLIWDTKQSWVSAAGAALAAVVIVILCLQSAVSPVATALAIPAAAIFYVANMRRYLRRTIWTRTPFPAEWRTLLSGSVQYYTKLDAAGKSDFERQILVFLKENRITGIGTSLDDQTRLLIAASAIILMFGRPEWEYRHLPEILVYPESFDRHYSFTSDRRKRNLAGIVVPQNAIVFSRQDLFYSFEEKGDPYHVGIHEFAHALDMSDGTAEGIPANLNPVFLEEWHRLMEAELRKVRKNDSFLDAYAGKSPAELFAVAVECFFEAPLQLKQSHHQLYEALASYLNQDPAGTN